MKQFGFSPPHPSMYWLSMTLSLNNKTQRVSPFALVRLSAYLIVTLADGGMANYMVREDGFRVIMSVPMNA
jgi:hypothetical protein